MELRGVAPKPSTVREIANILLVARGSTPPLTVGINRASTFINRHQPSWLASLTLLETILLPTRLQRRLKTATVVIFYLYRYRNNLWWWLFDLHVIFKGKDYIECWFDDLQETGESRYQTTAGPPMRPVSAGFRRYSFRLRIHACVGNIGYWFLANTAAILHPNLMESAKKTR